MISLQFDNGKTGAILVDWLSLSINVVFPDNVERLRIAPNIVGAVFGALGIERSRRDGLDKIVVVPSAKGYSESISLPDAGMRIDARTSGDCLVSWSGKGCIWLRSQKLMSVMMERACSQASRVDVAVDRPDERQPSDLIDMDSLPRDRTSVLWRSKTGETIYIGSMSSKRYARLYKYSDPEHERSDKLRLEVVFRGHVAKSAAKQIVAGKMLQLAVSEINRLDLQPYPEGANVSRETEEHISLYIKTRNPNTMKWLEDAVIPALQRLEADGDLPDAIAHLRHLLGRDKQDIIPE